MRSVVPSDSETVPLPDHAPSKPADGPDGAWPIDTENKSAAPTPAAVIACPYRLEPNRFISRFPFKFDVTSRRIEGLVSPRCVRVQIDRRPLTTPGSAGPSASRPDFHS